MSRLREKDIVSSELVPAFNKRGTYSYKIPDPPSAFGGKHTRFTKKRPYDFVASIGGKYLAGEAKLNKKMAAFGWDHLKDHQKEGLDSVVDNGDGLAYVFLIVRVKRDPEIGAIPMNRLYIFEYKFLKAEYERLGRNYKAKEIAEMPFYIGMKRDYMIDDFIKEIKGEI